MRISILCLVCCVGCANLANAQEMGVFDRLGAAEAAVQPPGVRLWSEMDARDRAELWPYLDQVTRSVHWRDMPKKEREAMRSHLSAAENEKIRHRYCLTEDSASHARTPRTGLSKFRDKDRTLMRQQIREVHIELGSGHAHRLRPPSAPQH